MRYPMFYDSVSKVNKHVFVNIEDLSKRSFQLRNFGQKCSEIYKFLPNMFNWKILNLCFIRSNPLRKIRLAIGHFFQR